MYYRLKLFVNYLLFTSMLDYTIAIVFENGTMTSHTVSAETLFLLIMIDVSSGIAFVSVMALNGAGAGMVGIPEVDRK